jgi:hypothetical protein
LGGVRVAEISGRQRREIECARRCHHANFNRHRNNFRRGCVGGCGRAVMKSKRQQRYGTSYGHQTHRTVGHGTGPLHLLRQHLRLSGPECAAEVLKTSEGVCRIGMGVLVASALHPLSRAARAAFFMMRCRHGTLTRCRIPSNHNRERSRVCDAP